MTGLGGPDDAVIGHDRVDLIGPERVVVGVEFMLSKDSEELTEGHVFEHMTTLIRPSDRPKSRETGAEGIDLRLCKDRCVAARPRTLMLDNSPLPGGPAADVALGPVLLARGLDDAQEIVRIHRPEPTAAFSRRDTRQPGYDRAATAVRGLGFEPVIRPQGGQLAAYHRGSVVIDHVVRQANPSAGLKGRFEHFAELHTTVLAGFGLDARIGQLAGEYCPGEFSVNAAGATKIVGSAQRITRDGWLFSTVIQVADSASIREALTRAYDEIGYELDPSTIGSMDDYVPGISAEAVEQAMRSEYIANLAAVEGHLSPELLEEFGA